MNIFNGLLFSIKDPSSCSTGLYIDLRKYWNFQSEAKVVIAIVTMRSVSCFSGNLVSYANSFHKNLVSFGKLIVWHRRWGDNPFSTRVYCRPILRSTIDRCPLFQSYLGWNLLYIKIFGAPAIHKKVPFWPILNAALNFESMACHRKHLMPVNVCKYVFT